MRTTIFITLSHTLFVFDMPGTPFGRRPGHMNLYTTRNRATSTGARIRLQQRNPAPLPTVEPPVELAEAA